MVRRGSRAWAKFLRAHLAEGHSIYSATELSALNARESFGVVLRTVGLLLVLYSIRIAAAVVGMWFFRPPSGIPRDAVAGMPDPRAMLVGPSLTGLVALAVGAYLLRGAPGVLAYSYPEPQRDTTPLGVRTAV